MKKLTLLSLLFLTLFACRKDVDETLSTETSTNTPTTTIVDYEPEVIPVTATLFGTITDENGVPMTNTTVRLNGEIETTDDSGRFLFKNLTMNAAGTFVEATKNGYFPGSHRFFPKEGSVNYATISLLTKTNTGNFASGDGGVITSSEGIQLDFPANSIINSDNEAYNGDVEVFARWIDPTADNLQAIMPGNLQGVNTSLEEVALASFGMIAVELESPTGESLNLGNDLKATLSIPVPAELLANAPAEIPLWYFEETLGLWVEEGSATLEGDRYVGEVAHFSFWNYDAPAPYITLSGTVVSDDGNPVPNAVVTLTIVSNGMSACGWTNDDGVFSGKVPDNEEFVMEIQFMYGACDVYTANIGPFTVDTDLGVITVTSPSLLDITGTIVDCNDDPVTNGWVEITISGATYTYYVDNGEDFSLAVFNCDNATDLTAFAVNLDDLEEGDVLTYTVVDPLDLGNVSACGNVLSEYLIMDIDGTVTTFAIPTIELLNDSTFLSAYGAGGGNDYNVFIEMQEFTSTGTYPGDQIKYLSMWLPGNGGDVSMQCNNNPSNPACGVTELVITQYGSNPGETIIGTFSGTGEFVDNMQTTVVLPYSGSFKVIRN